MGDRIKQASRPPRVRREPPTVHEAIDAARDIATSDDDVAQIAAALIGLPVQDVRSAIESSSKPGAGRPDSPQRMGGLVVERRTRRTIKAPV